MIRQLRSVKSAPSLRQSYNRMIHQSAPSTNPSNLLTSPSNYASLSLAGLRAECKKKGLKVGGRKAELIDRLSFHEIGGIKQQKQSISSTAIKLAKGDDSTIDFYKFPPSNYKPIDTTPDLKIPVPPDAYSSSVSSVPSDYAAPLDAESVALHATTVEHTEDISHVSGQNTASRLKDAIDNSAVSHPTTSTSEGSAEELSGRDKTVLASIAAAVGGWWLVGSFFDKKKKH